MSGRQVRVGQLIAPFGPGALYTDRRGIPLVVCGLDNWFHRSDPVKGMQQCDSIEEFNRFDERLADLLKVSCFRAPPDYRTARHGSKAPPNASLTTPAQRFPCWYRHSRTGEMRRFSLHSTKLEKTPSGRWLPVRFVAVCARGHLCEFPWQNWIGCSCPDDGDLVLTDRGGADLGSVRVHCRSCPADSPGKRGRSLARTTQRPDPLTEEQSAFQKAGIRCPGTRPWLGEGAREPECDSPLVGALINQTNLYFPRTVSAISLPGIEHHDEELARLRVAIEEDPSLGPAKTDWVANDRETAVFRIKKNLTKRDIETTEEQVEAVLAGLFGESAALVSGAAQPANPEPNLLTFRRSEFHVLRNRIDDPQRFPNLRVIPMQVPIEIGDWFSRLNLVERLRETRVFYGFDRLEPSRDPLNEMPDFAMNQLFRSPPTDPSARWLPAVDVYGEGLFFELGEKQILGWQRRNVEWLSTRVTSGFVERLVGEPVTLPPLTKPDLQWASRFLLVHSLAHILINQLIFECGYSTASLRERLYVSSDPVAPMAGLLIYTSAGDSEVTLGGLVRLGHAERIVPLIKRALSRAAWCSADPVCSEQSGSGSRLVNLAACHACVLLPETCCETINHGLDRALVIGTPKRRDPGFMVRSLDAVHVLG